RAIDVAYVGSAANARLAQVGGAAPVSTAAAPRLELSRGAETAASRGFNRPGWPTPQTSAVGEEGNAASVVDDIIRRGVEIGATDIHFEPLDDVIKIQYRIDGMLTDGATFPKSSQSS